MSWVVPLPSNTHHQDDITYLVGNPYKPSFATVTGRGDNPKYVPNGQDKIVRYKKSIRQGKIMWRKNDADAFGAKKTGQTVWSTKPAWMLLHPGPTDKSEDWQESPYKSKPLPLFVCSGIPGVHRCFSKQMTSYSIIPCSFHLFNSNLKFSVANLTSYLPHS